MFENYATMSDADKAQVKAIHQAIRALPEGRYRNLAWGFVRGFPYRRVERCTRTQDMGDGTKVVHNKPSAPVLSRTIGGVIPGFAEDLGAWLASEAGAIPAPVREKKPRGRAA